MPARGTMEAALFYGMTKILIQLYSPTALNAESLLQSPTPAISTDGGITWLNDQGPIYGTQLNQTGSCAILGPHRGRYPNGVLFNPPGNTDPVNAHIIYAGSWNTDILSMTTWQGQVYGVGNLNGSAPVEHYDSLPSTWFSPEDLFVTKQGTIWKIGSVGWRDPNGYSYADTVGIYKGIWNGNDFDYTYYPVHYILNPYPTQIGDLNIAFGDDGLTGYIAMITNQDSTYTVYPDTAFYIQVLKTVDGGNSWSCPTDIVLAGSMDSALLVLNNRNRYGTYWDLDIVVDKNNNLHIVTAVVPIFGTDFSVYVNYPYKTFGLFDFYTNDGGNSYQAQLIAHPATILGSGGLTQITESLRPFASRTWDGSKLFFGWFDTDTSIYFTNQNEFPDLHLIGYDVDANMWTADLSNLQAVDAGENITAGTTAAGLCNVGNGSYYVIDSAGNYKVPVTYLVQPNINFSEVDFHYIDCASPSGTFTHPGHPLPIPVMHASSLCDDGSGVVLSTEKITSDLIVSSNYPNPFTGKTSVDVTLEKAGDVSVEISNVVGQILIAANYKNLHAGLNTIILDGSSLSGGLYFFSVSSGNKSSSGKMMIQ